MHVRLRHILALLVLWAMGLALVIPAAAGVRQSDDKIVDATTRRVIESLPDMGTDLPPFLSGPRDVYLFCTAGAAYTDVRVLADPAIDPKSLAHALEAAEADTVLAGTAVEWSADSYAAARLVRKTGRLGRQAGLNRVPVGALITGLRRAGFVPHPLLRIPRYARVAGLPPASAGTTRYRWYDGHALSHAGTVGVSARLTPSRLWPLLLPLLAPLLSLLGLGLAMRLANDERRPLAQRRRLFESLTNVPLFGAVLMAPVLVFALRSTAVLASADLWFGSGKTTPLVLPLIIALSLTTMPFFIVGKRCAVKLFGKPETAKPWLSEEEKALQKRMQKWGAVPHLIGMTAAAALLFFVPHRSPVYSVVHPLSQFFMFAGAALVPRLFRKQAAALTRKTVDDDLTFRARRFGQLLGTRPREVWIEESSRAAHFIGSYREQDHIVVTRKMREELSPAEMDFVLAQHVAALGQRKSAAGALAGLAALGPLLLVPGILVLLHHRTPGSASLILSPWFLPALIAAPFLSLVPMLLAIRQSTKNSVAREQASDQKALEATGDLAAALGAVSRLEALPPGIGAAASATAHRDTGAQAGRREGRLAALEQAAGQLRLAPAPASDRRYSPFAGPVEGRE